MLEQTCKLSRFNLWLMEALTADIQETEMTLQPAPDVNPPVWILGHLAVATDYAAKALGGERKCPREWHAEFGPGSAAAPQKTRPTKAELLTAIREGHERLATLASQATADHLARPHEVELLKATPLKTIGDLVAHLMSTHESQHLGQLSMWCRLTGRKPLV